MINKKKEGGFYASKVRLFLNEYDGIPLESTVKTCDKRLPNKDEKEDEVEDELHYFRRWMYCHHAGPLKLTQFVFFGRGRRTQEAIKEYFKDVMDRLYLHSDGAKMYKCYNIAGLILRISCLVHMRRPFFKLKQQKDWQGYCHILQTVRIIKLIPLHIYVMFSVA